MKSIIATHLFLLALACRALALPCPEQIIASKASEIFMLASPEQARELMVPITSSNGTQTVDKAREIVRRLQMLGLNAAKVLGTMTVKNSCRLVGKNTCRQPAIPFHYEISLKRGRLPN